MFIEVVSYNAEIYLALCTQQEKFISLELMKKIIFIESTGPTGLLNDALTENICVGGLQGRTGKKTFDQGRHDRRYSASNLRPCSNDSVTLTTWPAVLPGPLTQPDNDICSV